MGVGDWEGNVCDYKKASRRMLVVMAWLSILIVVIYT